MELVDRWALTGRSPKSIDWQAAQGGHNHSAQNGALAKKCSLSVMFKDYEAVLSIYDGQMLTLGICHDLHRARYLWKQAKEGYNRHEAAKNWRR